MVLFQRRRISLSHHPILKLKKVINQLVHELEALGLDPVTLQSLQSDQVTRTDPGELPFQIQLVRDSSAGPTTSLNNSPKLVYEIVGTAGSGIEPRLRIRLPERHIKPRASMAQHQSGSEELSISSPTSILWTLSNQSAAVDEGNLDGTASITEVDTDERYLSW